MIDLALLVDFDWRPVEVINVAVVVMFKWVLVVDSWVRVLSIEAMVSMSVVIEPIQFLQLAPDGSVVDGLDFSLLSESWLVCNWKHLLFKLDILNWLVPGSVELMSGIVIGSPSRGTHGDEGK